MSWLIEHWKTILAVFSFLSSVPIFLVVRKAIRVSRNQLALEICQEDLRLTTGRVLRLNEHLKAAGIDLSPVSQATPPMSSSPNETSSTDP